MTETDSSIIPPMLFFCRDCQKVVVDPKKKGGKYVYICPICNKDRVAFGTGRAICDFFHIKESMLKKMLDNPNQS